MCNVEISQYCLYSNLLVPLIFWFDKFYKTQSDQSRGSDFLMTDTLSKLNGSGNKIIVK